MNLTTLSLLNQLKNKKIVQEKQLIRVNWIRKFVWLEKKLMTSSKGILKQNAKAGNDIFFIQLSYKLKHSF